ncbi:hypothetical protein F3J40_21045 [Pantoea sp. Acro-835]|uniref:High mobility group protein Z n=1 Tax=Candidatus Pantoea multigeneris TaxID=2608357 RepID=A0ABX0RKX3_9GAMM|nr:hypothetical protein [Pantoea multigeneris]
MLWPGSILALMLACFLAVLLFKLRRLSRLKSRLRRAVTASALRPSYRTSRKELPCPRSKRSGTRR